MNWWQQMSTGHLHLEGFESPHPLEKEKTTLLGGLSFSGGDWGTRTLDLMRVKHAL